VTPTDPSVRIKPVVLAVSCVLVFIAKAASNFFLLADFFGVRLGVMAAKKNPGGSIAFLL
jgi:hypothetical protein